MIAGRGVHTGHPAQVRIVAAAPGSGRCFVRTDLPGAPVIPVSPAALRSSMLSTALEARGASVQTIEHLMAALWNAGAQDVRVELDGPEVPILDGSAAPWVDLLGARSCPWVGPPLRRPLVLREGSSWVAALVSQELRFSCGIEFPDPIGAGWVSFAVRRGSFRDEVAPARTFAGRSEVERLRASGGLRGGDLTCALVFDEGGWLNPPLRFADEPARHKLLDLIGDLALLGAIPRAHYVAFRAGHRLHGRLALALARGATGAPPAG
jgi:UDP-3-O-[3-hydroxymyristoyl] N-acetylglucosamine deacetylase